MKAAGAVGTLAVLGGAAMADSHQEDDATDEETPETMPEQGEAAVSVGHFSPDAPAVDVRLDDETVATGVEYGEVSGYMNVDAGTYTVQILEAGAAGPTEPGTPEDGTPDGTPDGTTDDNVTVDTPEETDGTGGTTDSEPIYEEEVTVGETFYTIAAVGELEQESVRALVLEDYDVAQVRLVHTSPDAPLVDVTVADSNLTLFDRVRFGESTDYVTVPGGDYTLEVREASPTQSGPVVATFDTQVESGLAYSAFASGYVAETETPDGTDDSTDDNVTDDTPDGTPDDTTGGTETGRPPLELFVTIDGVTSLQPDDDGTETPDGTDDTPDGTDGTDDGLNGTDDTPDGTMDDNVTDGMDGTDDTLNDTDDNTTDGT